mgnify:CR=1 FL=1
MSWVQIWVHVVFSTKYRKPFLKEDVRKTVHQHIIDNCKKKDIFLQSINGWTDHLHCLISLGKVQNIAEVTQLIKGESSFWINKEALIPEKFAWQDDYWAASVSESGRKSVERYIANQEVHHNNQSFENEIEIFYTTGHF